MEKYDQSVSGTATITSKRGDGRETVDPTARQFEALIGMEKKKLRVARVKERRWQQTADSWNEWAAVLLAGVGRSGPRKGGQ